MTRTGLRLSVLALLAWLLCFFALARLGTWTPFAFVGVSLVSLTLLCKAVPRALLRPSWRTITLGLLGGVLMVLFTHAAYRQVAAVVPGVRGATADLLALLNVVGFTLPQRACLIVVIATCEEILFRGPLLDSLARSTAPHARWPVRRGLTLLVVFAMVYAATTVPLGSPLLVLCAFACGSVWSIMRVATGSLVVPIVAHVVWDLGVLLVWPLTA